MVGDEVARTSGGLTIYFVELYDPEYFTLRVGRIGKWSERREATGTSWVRLSSRSRHVQHCEFRAVCRSFPDRQLWRRCETTVVGHGTCAFSQVGRRRGSR